MLIITKKKKKKKKKEAIQTFNYHSVYVTLTVFLSNQLLSFFVITFVVILVFSKYNSFMT